MPVPIPYRKSCKLAIQCLNRQTQPGSFLRLQCLSLSERQRPSAVRDPSKLLTWAKVGAESYLAVPPNEFPLMAIYRYRLFGMLYC